jgi:ABC-type spermidine/putrescine transport system permease subunit II
VCFPHCGASPLNACYVTLPLIMPGVIAGAPWRSPTIDDFVITSLPRAPTVTLPLQIYSMIKTPSRRGQRCVDALMR